MANPIDFFATCIVDAFYPDVGMAAVKALEKRGYEVSAPPEQTCCGLPLYNNGFVDEAREVARHTVSALPGEAPIVLPSGSCAWMMRTIYPTLLPPEIGKPFAARVRELSELLGAGAIAPGKLAAPRKIAYHPSCHLRRGLHVDEPPRALLRSLDGAELVPLAQEEDCCGFGGTFAVRYGQVSTAMLDDKLAHARASGAESLVVTDAGCLMHLDGGAKKAGCPFRVQHIAELLAEDSPDEDSPDEDLAK